MFDVLFEWRIADIGGKKRGVKPYDTKAAVGYRKAVTQALVKGDCLANRQGVAKAPDDREDQGYREYGTPFAVPEHSVHVLFAVSPHSEHTPLTLPIVTSNGRRRRIL